MEFPHPKETLVAFLGHLEDAFLVFTLPVASRSDRRRQVNPRELYLADHSLALAFSPALGHDRGRHVENFIACELARESRNLAYVKTASGYEVDFLATDFTGRRELIQAVSDSSSTTTLEREIRAMVKAGREFPDAARILLTGTGPSSSFDAPDGIEIVPEWRWLLEKK